MKKLTFGIIILVVVFGFFGCAKQEYIYIKENTKMTTRQQFSIDKSKCLQRANQSIQVPIQMPCFGKGFSKGLCEGEKSRQLKEYRIIKNEIMDGCMAQYGYVKKLKN